MVLTGMSPKIFKVFDLLGLPALFTIRPTLDEGIQALPTRPSWAVAMDPWILSACRSPASSSELKEQGSRFIAHLAPAASPAAAMALLESLRKRYHDATHHCWAYRLGWARACCRGPRTTASRATRRASPSSERSRRRRFRRGPRRGALFRGREAGHRRARPRLQRRREAGARARPPRPETLTEEWLVSLPYGAQGSLRHAAEALGVELGEQAFGRGRDGRGQGSQGSARSAFAAPTGEARASSGRGRSGGNRSEGPRGRSRGGPRAGPRASATSVVQPAAFRGQHPLRLPGPFPLPLRAASSGSGRRPDHALLTFKGKVVHDPQFKVRPEMETTCDERPRPPGHPGEHRPEALLPLREVPRGIPGGGRAALPGRAALRAASWSWRATRPPSRPSPRPWSWTPRPSSSAPTRTSTVSTAAPSASPSATSSSPQARHARP